MQKVVGNLTKADVGSVVAVEYTDFKKAPITWAQRLNPLAKNREIPVKHVVRGVLHEVRQVTEGGSDLPPGGVQRTFMTFVKLENALDPLAPPDKMKFVPASAKARTLIAPGAHISVKLPQEPFFSFSFSRDCVAHLVRDEKSAAAKSTQ